VAGGAKVSQVLWTVVSIVSVDVVNLEGNLLLFSETENGLATTPNTVISQHAHCNQGQSVAPEIVERGVLHQDVIEKPLASIGAFPNGWGTPGGLCTMREDKVGGVQPKVSYLPCNPLR
jgi:hypothetical protein